MDAFYALEMWLLSAIAAVLHALATPHLVPRLDLLGLLTVLTLASFLEHTR